MNSGDRVRALRVALGHSQAALAALTGVLDQSYINKIESGRNKASTHHVRSALARAFRLSWEDFALYLEGKIALKTVLARTSGGSVTDSASAVPPPIHDDMIVAVPDESGSSEQVPLRELIRAYRLASRQRGAADIEAMEERVKTAEMRVQEQGSRLIAVEKMLAEVEVRMAEAGLLPMETRSAHVASPAAARPRSLQSRGKT